MNLSRFIRNIFHPILFLNEDFWEFGSLRQMHTQIPEKISLNDSNYSFLHTQNFVSLFLTGRLPNLPHNLPRKKMLPNLFLRLTGGAREITPQSSLQLPSQKYGPMAG